MSDYSGQADGGRIGVPLVVADETQYLSSPDRAGRRDLLLSNRHLPAKPLVPPVVL
jgi:hypothetical protein